MQGSEAEARKLAACVASHHAQGMKPQPSASSCCTGTGNRRAYELSNQFGCRGRTASNLAGAPCKRCPAQGSRRAKAAEYRSCACTAFPCMGQAAPRLYKEARGHAGYCSVQACIWGYRVSMCSFPDLCASAAAGNTIQAMYDLVLGVLGRLGHTGSPGDPCGQGWLLQLCSAWP